MRTIARWVIYFTVAICLCSRSYAAEADGANSKKADAADAKKADGADAKKADGADVKKPDGDDKKADGADSKKDPPKPAAGTFADISIEDLLNIKITSVSKKVEKVSEAASAIYVITGEDLRRTGVTTVADALRMAPGMDVAQNKSNGWAISSRGFNGALANKLLVLIDGRSVYTPLYAGVYWDVQDTMLEDIDRIEVIRGPGATVWGANAVNGVINIITKDSKDTQGGLASGSVGTFDETIDSVRYGGKIGEKVTYRAFLKYAKRDELSLGATDTAAHDGWEVGRAGTRFDIRASKEDKITIEGDYYNGAYEEKPTVVDLAPPFADKITNTARMSGADAIARWNHSFSDTSETSLQVYYDRTERDEVRLAQTIETADIDFNHHLKIGRNEIVYGAGYRFVKETLDNTFYISFDPNDRKTNLLSAFLQDEITVLEDKFSVTLGSKFERNDFSGFEIQPSIKTLWHAAKNHTVWSSVSRAVRTPSPIETDLRANLAAGATAPGAPTILFSLFPNLHIPSETLIAYELGYRAQLHKRFSIDATGFYNVYDNLRSNEGVAGKILVEPNPAPLHLTIPIVQRPYVNAETYGGELAATWEPTNKIKFSAGYSYLQMLLHRNSRANAKDAEIAEGQSPNNQFNVRAYIDLPHNLQFDSGLYYVDRLDKEKIPSYTRIDSRLGWKPLDRLDVSLGAQNMFRKEHEEFGDGNSKIERNVYFKLTLKF